MSVKFSTHFRITTLNKIDVMIPMMHLICHCDLCNNVIGFFFNMAGNPYVDIFPYFNWQLGFDSLPVSCYTYCPVCKYIMN